MKVQRLLFSALLLLTRLLYAQTDFRPGYIIKLNGDTLNGEIDYRGDLLMGEICSFKITDKENEIKFPADDLIGYRFKDSKYFVSREINGEKIFLEFLIKGKINIYYLRDAKGDHYFIEKDSTGVVEIPFKETIVYKDNKVYSCKSTKYIGILNIYMQDAPELKSRIDKMKKPNHENLIKLSEDYHNIVCKDESCIIYEKILPWLKTNLEFTGGIAKYSNLVNIKDKNYFQLGILANFWMPRLNEKFFFRTGILCSNLEFYNNEKEVVYKIPIQFEYLYPKGIVKPKLAYGINIYKPIYQSVSLMGGVNINLNKSFCIIIDYDIDFAPIPGFPVLPKSICSQSIQMGLQIQL